VQGPDPGVGCRPLRRVAVSEGIVSGWIAVAILVYLLVQHYRHVTDPRVTQDQLDHERAENRKSLGPSFT